MIVAAHEACESPVSGSRSASWVGKPYPLLWETLSANEQLLKVLIFVDGVGIAIGVKPVPAVLELPCATFDPAEASALRLGCEERLGTLNTVGCQRAAIFYSSCG